MTNDYTEVPKKEVDYAQILKSMEAPELIPFMALQSEPLPEFDFGNAYVLAIDLSNVLLNKMISLSGVGLSANQVGIPVKVFVFGKPGDFDTAINSNIIGYSKEKVAIKEGCLSFPGLWLTISRPIVIVASYQTVLGETKTVEIGGLTSRIFQHEYDHMMGRNFLQLASPLKLSMALKALKKHNANRHKNEDSHT